MYNFYSGTSYTTGITEFWSLPLEQYLKLVLISNPAKFCFSTKMLKFQHYEVIIYDVSGDFGILFGLWNRLIMNYLCAKFHCDTSIIDM